MYLAKVVGTVISTSENERLAGLKLLLTQRAHSDGAAVGDREIAVDIVGVGTSETVIITRGSSARFVTNRQRAPPDATIAGIVGMIEVED